VVGSTSKDTRAIVNSFLIVSSSCSAAYLRPPISSNASMRPVIAVERRISTRRSTFVLPIPNPAAPTGKAQREHGFDTNPWMPPRRILDTSPVSRRRRHRDGAGRVCDRGRRGEQVGFTLDKRITGVSQIVARGKQFDDRAESLPISVQVGIVGVP
jgi:hypothetical protein